MSLRLGYDAGMMNSGSVYVSETLHKNKTAFMMSDDGASRFGSVDKELNRFVPQLLKELPFSLPSSVTFRDHGPQTVKGYTPWHLC